MTIASESLLFLTSTVGLFTFGVAYITRYTSGPLDVFEKIRAHFGLRRLPLIDNGSGEEVVVDYVEESDGSFFAKLLACWWCYSTWVSLFGTILAGCEFGFGLHSAIVWFGAIAVAGVIHKFIED